VSDHGQPKAPVKTGPDRRSVAIPGRNSSISASVPSAEPKFTDVTAKVPEVAETAHPALDAAGCLLRALGTQIPAQKREMAKRGLELDDGDEELRALLLRQMYLAELEDENDASALEIAAEMIQLGTLGDISRQDAARAAVGVGDLDAAIGHLRIAARVCPAPRRAFHYAHLGALLRFEGHLDLAVEAFENATRWATDDRSLYQAVKALAESDCGKNETDLGPLRDSLRESGRRGYALWVLGELSLKLGDNSAAREYLEQFLSRVTEAPRAKTLSLRSEIRHCQELLNKLSA